MGSAFGDVGARFNEAGIEWYIFALRASLARCDVKPFEIEKVVHTGLWQG
jgi:hypothetical protein